MQNLEVLLVEEFNLICYQEDLMLQEKAKIDWIRYGDFNSKFYHTIIKGNGSRKFRKALKNSDYEWCFTGKIRLN